jgi:hypothetical protein
VILFKIWLNTRFVFYGKQKKKDLGDFFLKSFFFVKKINLLTSTFSHKLPVFSANAISISIAFKSFLVCKVVSFFSSKMCLNVYVCLPYWYSLHLATSCGGASFIPSLLPCCYTITLCSFLSLVCGVVW